MVRRSVWLVLLLAASCKHSEARPDHHAADSVSHADDPWKAGTGSAKEPCERLPFAETLPIPEASGAVLLPDGMLVVSDSGNLGKYIIVDKDTGALISEGTLPLGEGASDDLEGLALAPDGRLWGVTSSGYLRAWRRDGATFTLVDGPYALGHKLTCKPMDVNCGANLEGLCLSPKVEEDDDCVGFVASKADGHLYCLQRKGDRLRSEAKLSIAITDADALSDCGFDPEGDAVWTGSNMLDGSQVYRLTDWRDTTDPELTDIGSLGVGFPEVIVVGEGGVVYRLSDAATSTSLAGRWKCGPR